MNNFKSNQNINSTKTMSYSEKVRKALEKLKHPPVSFKQLGTLNMSLIRKHVQKPKELVTKISEVKNTYKKKEYMEADYGKNN